MKSLAVQKKKAQGKESVCGLRHDDVIRQGLSERRVPHEKYGTSPPRTLQYSEHEAPAFGDKESQGLRLSVVTCQRRDSQARLKPDFPSSKFLLPGSQ